MPMWTRRRNAALFPFPLRGIRMSGVMVRVITFTEPAVIGGFAGRPRGACLSPQHLGGEARRIRSYIANARAT